MEEQPPTSQFQNLFSHLGYSFEEKEINEWLESDHGVQVLSDEEIIESVNKDENGNESELEESPNS